MIDVDALSDLIDARIREALADQAGSPALLRVSQVADLLGMSTRTAYDRIADGSLQAVRDRGQIRVTREAVDAYAAGCSPVETPKRGRLTVPARRQTSKQSTSDWD